MLRGVQIVTKLCIIMKKLIIQMSLTLALATSFGCNQPGTSGSEEGSSTGTPSTEESGSSEAGSSTGSSSTGGSSGSSGSDESSTSTTSGDTGGSSGSSSSDESSTSTASGDTGGSSSDTSSGTSSESEGSSSSNASSSEESSSTGGDIGHAVLNDEFDGSLNLLTEEQDSWEVLFGENASSIQIGSPLDGFLTMTGVGFVSNGWYANGHGPAVVKRVGGNFVAMIDVTSLAADTGVDSYNSAGFLIRDPNSASGTENWMSFNLGAQQSYYGLELKKTVNSVSSYFLDPHAGTTEQLLVCRIDQTFYFYNWNEASSQWDARYVYNQFPSPEGNLHTTQVLSSPDQFLPEISLPVEGGASLLAFTYGNAPGVPAMPDELQVGLMLNAYYSPHDIQGNFDYIRFGSVVPATQADCISELQPE